MAFVGLSMLEQRYLAVREVPIFGMAKTPTVENASFTSRFSSRHPHRQRACVARCTSALSWRHYGDEMPSTMRKIAVVWVLLTVLSLLSACGADSLNSRGDEASIPPPKAIPKVVSIKSSSPYYVAAKALLGTQVQAGTVIAGCTINAFTKCAGSQLSDRSLQGAFLAYSDLSAANMARVNLLQADVSFANLDGVDLSAAELNATSTTKATFRNARLANSQWVLVAGSNTDFSGADLRGANFTSASLAISKLTDADLTGANLTLADLTGVDLKGANLNDANFCQTTMPDGTVRNPQPSAAAAMATCGHSAPSTDPALVIDDTNPYFALALTYDKPFVSAKTTIRGCRLVPRASCRRANLSHRDLTGAIIPYAQVQGANFLGSDMTAVVLDLAHGEAANLRGVVLVNGTMAGGQFARANLSGATLVFASLNGTDLRGADLSHANLRFGSIVGADATGANLTGVQLPSSNANGTNFTNANLSGANLSNADLTGASLDGANLAGADFCNTLMPDGSVRNPSAGLCPNQ
jgi:uncharacterized protein YjbI with pentapeptide repeats